MPVAVAGAASVEPYAPADAAAWEAFVRTSPASAFGQRRSWCDLLRSAMGCEEHSMLARHADRVVGVLPLFKRPGPHALFTPPGGLLATGADVAAALVDAAAAAVREGRAPWIELRDQRQRWPQLDTVEENATMVLRLERDEDAQWRAFDAKLRNQIRKGMKAGFTVHWGPGEVRAFHYVLLENMRDLGTPIMGPEYFTAVLEAFGDDATLLVLRRDGRPAGAMFLIRHGDTLIDPWASSVRQYLRDCPNQVLYWEAIRFAIRKGLACFDFGRSQWNSNTFRFKSQWGAEAVPLYYQYVMAPGRRPPTVADQKHRLAIAAQAWRRLPLGLAGWLGPRVRRLFPEAL